jgi:hypothetical protein
MLHSFERHYGLKSEDFYEHHLADTVPAEIAGFQRAVWVAFVRESRRLRDPFVVNTERLLSLA